MSLRILLLEDEPGLVLTLTDLLATAGHQADCALDGISGLEKARSAKYDVILLDVMLPRMDGFAVCAKLRKEDVETPILMLTARAQVDDRIQGLKLGADDYLAKPFDPNELLARIDALVRRTKPKPLLRVTFGDVEMDFARAEARRDGQAITLVGKELQLLRYFVDNPHREIPREELLREVWNYHESVSSRTIDVHIAMLRQKLEENPRLPRHFHTARGTGYRFTP